MEKGVWWGKERKDLKNLNINRSAPGKGKWERFRSVAHCTGRRAGVEKGVTKFNR